ncbi:restriction endonuclease subunit S [uncultured Treponema sp.]|uniref:restriction endonuclease subunit S n=1 Tax=uncultured Treponema sp. TaxID=162155 RepID=UPI00258FA722|nr:restriction endonuclease subunit S [uncultured Treponema sp.]
MENVSSRCGKSDNAPRLRFPEFRGKWIEKKLGEIFKKNTEKNTELKITNVICNSAKNGLIPQREYFDKDIANSENINGYYIIQKYDFVYNPRKSTEAPYGPVSVYKYPDKGIVSPLYLCFRATEEINSDFYEFYFKSYSWHRYIYLSGDNGARHDRVSMRDDVFFAMPVNIPSLPEQKKIAAFFTLLDRRIQKQRQLVECLKTYKRGVIKQYFSAQKDNTKWTKSTISNCLFYEQPQKYIVHSEHYSNTYETPVLTANKAFILGYTNELDGIYDKGDVLIYDDFTMEVKYVDFPFKVKSSTIKMLTPQSGIDLYFMFTLLKSLDLQPEGHQRSYISILEPMEVNIPCYEEQARASGIFRLLDKQIEKEQQLLHKILDLKSSLLQKMFI